METAVPIAELATSITSLFKISDLQTIIAATGSASAGFVVAWFGVRKISRGVMSAFKRGRLSI